MRVLTAIFLVLSTLLLDSCAVSRGEARIVEAYRAVVGRYVDEVDSSLLADDAVRGMISGLDPYTVFLSAEEARHLDDRLGGRDSVPVVSSEMITGSVGRLRISIFARNTRREAVRHIRELLGQGMTSLVLDLRDNPGGYLEEGVELASEFLSKGDIVCRVVGRRGRSSVYRADGRGHFRNLPLTVLVNGGSASSSEVVAAALQDHGRAVVAGERTMGKGLVQNTVRFSDGSVLLVTTMRYFTPSGRCVQKPWQGDVDGEWGVIPARKAL